MQGWFSFIFDKKIVTYVKSKRKGHREDFDFEELEAAIELYKEHEEEDKQYRAKHRSTAHVLLVMPATGAIRSYVVEELKVEKLKHLSSS